MVSPGRSPGAIHGVPSHRSWDSPFGSWSSRTRAGRGPTPALPRHLRRSGTSHSPGSRGCSTSPGETVDPPGFLRVKHHETNKKNGSRSTPGPNSWLPPRIETFPGIFEILRVSLWISPQGFKHDVCWICLGTMSWEQPAAATRATREAPAFLESDHPCIQLEKPALQS